jgi:tetratricopeptide (TPR) repeat protein
LHGPDFSVWAAAALLDASVAVAEDLLERLVEAQLLQAAGDDAAGQARYRFHNLLRVYARAHLEQQSDRAQRAAMERVLDAQLTLAWHARSAGWPIDTREVARGRAPRWLPDQASIRAAASSPLAWFQAELPGLLGGVRQAWDAWLDEVAWELACVLTSPLGVRGDWRNWWSTHELALAACRRAGNRFGEAQVLRSLGDFYLHTERDERSMACFDEALTIFWDLGDQRGEAYARVGLGFQLIRHGDLDRAGACFDRCLEHFERTGDQAGVAVAVRGLAGLHRVAGRLDQAAGYFRRCLEMFERLADRDWEGAALLSYASLHQARGQLDEAAACYRRCLAIFQELADQRRQAITYAGSRSSTWSGASLARPWPASTFASRSSRSSTSAPRRRDPWRLWARRLPCTATRLRRSAHGSAPTRSSRSSACPKPPRSGTGSRSAARWRLGRSAAGAGECGI